VSRRSNARHGRHIIRQASAIPFRRRRGSIEFCLITSISSGRWGFPKGIIDPGDTAVITALKEAREEAGLDGRIIGDPLGEYTYHKWETSLVVETLLMEVTAEEAHWQEAELRDRRWCTADEARNLVDRDELRWLIGAAIERLGS